MRIKITFEADDGFLSNPPTNEELKETTEAIVNSLSDVELEVYEDTVKIEVISDSI